MNRRTAEARILRRGSFDWSMAESSSYAGITRVRF
jgi:hypothetical protein